MVNGELRLPIWIWNVTAHLPGGLPMGSAKDLDAAIQSGMGSVEGQDDAGAARGGL